MMIMHILYFFRKINALLDHIEIRIILLNFINNYRLIAALRIYCNFALQSSILNIVCYSPSAYGSPSW